MKSSGMKTWCVAVKQLPYSVARCDHTPQIGLSAQGQPFQIRACYICPAWNMPQLWPWPVCGERIAGENQLQATLSDSLQVVLRLLQYLRTWTVQPGVLSRFVSYF
jgi:hypothetical protein